MCSQPISCSLVWAAVTLFHSGICTAAGPAATLAAEHVQQARPSPPRCMLQCRIAGVSECAFARGADHSQTFQLDSTCFRDGERVDVQTTRRDNGKPLRSWRSIVNGWYVSYEVPPPGKTALSGLYAADGSSFAGAAVPSGWGVFDGYVAGDYVRFSDLLRSAAKVETAQEQVDGCRCLALKTDLPDYGSYQVWLDPAADYLPRKAAVTKTAGNYWCGTRLEQWTKLAPRGSRGTVRLQSVSYTMDHAKFDQVQGRFFPLACRVTRIQRYEDGNVESTIMDCRRTAQDLDPDFEGARAFVPELRQGARLANLVDQHLPYQWSDGAPVPLVEAGLVAQMDRTARTLKQELDRKDGSEGR
jgi:hypothetical protein